MLALPDSITLVSGQSSLRLESYLFTKQALTTARDRLAPGGVFTMYNYYRQPWLIDRYGNTLQQVFGGPPCQKVLIKPPVGRVARLVRGEHGQQQPQLRGRHRVGVLAGDGQGAVSRHR